MISSIRSKIYFVTPPDVADLRCLLDLVRAAIRGGAGMIQYRAKNRSTRIMVEEARSLLELTRPAEVPLIVNDRVDVALAVGADGVHIGQEDMPVADARRIIGPHAILGVTAPVLAEARQAQHAAATYVSCGPVFASLTKPDKPPLGPLAVQHLQTAISLPVCAIGGITEDTLPHLSEVNPALVAVSSAISQTDEVQATTKRLVKLAEQVIPRPTFGP